MLQDLIGTPEFIVTKITMIDYLKILKDKMDIMDDKMNYFRIFGNYRKGLNGNRTEK